MTLPNNTFLSNISTYHCLKFKWRWQSSIGRVVVCIRRIGCLLKNKNYQFQYEEGEREREKKKVEI